MPIKQKPIFDEEAKSWESLYKGSSDARWGLLQGYARKRVRARLELCFSMLPPLKGKNVIELGCGPGYYGDRIIHNGARWTGVDLSEKMLALCRENTGSSRLIRADVRALPFTHNCVAVILCIGVLSYLSKSEIFSLFSQVHNVLRPGGIFLAQTVRFDPVTWIRCRLPRWIPRPLRIPGPFYPRSPSKITCLLERSGLSLQRITHYRKFLFYPAGTVYLARAE